MYQSFNSVQPTGLVYNVNCLPRNTSEGYSFALNEGLIKPPPLCKKRAKSHNRYSNEPFSRYDVGTFGLGRYRCPKLKKCRPDIPVTEGSWFSNAKFKGIHQEIRLLYGFAHNESYDRIRTECSNLENKCFVSSDTIAARFKFCKEVVVNAFSKMQHNSGKIGGPGIVVQIDESKFGHRKYNRGRLLEGHWVLGMIANNSEDVRMVVCPDNIRNAETLLPIIKEHVAMGSIIHSDEWGAYKQLCDHGYTHYTVNHSVEFVAQDGTHTQRIEATWRPAKLWFKTKTNSQKTFSLDLCVYLWRRWIKKRNLDQFKALLEAIRLEYGDFR